MGDDHDRAAVIVMLHIIAEARLDVAIGAGEDRIRIEPVEHAADGRDGARTIDRYERPADAGIAGELDLDGGALFHAGRQIGVEAGVARDGRIEIEAIGGRIGGGPGNDRRTIAVRAELDRVGRRAGVRAPRQAQPVRLVRIVGGTGRPFRLGVCGCCGDGRHEQQQSGFSHRSPQMPGCAIHARPGLRWPRPKPQIGPKFNHFLVPPPFRSGRRPESAAICRRTGPPAPFGCGRPRCVQAGPFRQRPRAVRATRPSWIR